MRSHIRQKLMTELVNGIHDTSEDTSVDNNEANETSDTN